MSTLFALTSRTWLSAPFTVLAAAAVLGAPSQVTAQAALGSAQSFAVLGASTVTNTGATTIIGNLGVYPGSAITGSGTITLTGTEHIDDGVAQNAQADALTAFNSWQNFIPFTDLTGSDLGSVGPLAPGAYRFSSDAQLNGALILDFAAGPGNFFLFEIGTSLITGSGSSVSVLNGTSASEVFWQVGSSATLGTSTSFEGNIIADQSITLNTSATITCGRAIALNAAVTMDNNTIENDCPNDFGSYGFSGGGSPGATGTPVILSPTPEPSTFVLLGSACVALGGFVRRRRRPSAPRSRPTTI